MGKKYKSVLVLLIMMVARVASHDYGDALSKCILFFEGQRSGKLPSTQRMTWRKDSALRDGSDIGVDLVGGYYDAGDNVKFNFPMAFTTTTLAWSILEFGGHMDNDLKHAVEALRWGTDYFLKATSVPGKVFVQVGDPYGDHNCWERPEDMDTPRTTYVVNTTNPGSEVSGEIAAALAAASTVFKSIDRQYSEMLLQRASQVFQFGNQYRGSYNFSVEYAVCPFYCDFGGFMDELIWAAAWLYKATNGHNYLKYVLENIHYLENMTVVRQLNLNEPIIEGGSFAEFGWDSKHAGINVLLYGLTMNTPKYPFVEFADKFVCSVLPESRAKSVRYSPGGLLFKDGGTNSQHTTAMSFLLLVYSGYLVRAHNRNVECGNNVVVTPARLVQFTKGQVDYILGNNPMKMSYMVGYGRYFPKKCHHRGSTLPSVDRHPKRIKCREGDLFFGMKYPNFNELTGAIVGGPDINDYYNDTRVDFRHSEPTTYVNAPFVGVLGFFKANPSGKL